MESVRLDRSGTISNVRRTPQGGLILNARLTRVGVFLYQKADGSVVRELRPPEEVFAPESLATLAHAPITDNHPAKPVSPENWKEVTIGHIAGTPTRDGDFVAGEVLVQDADAMQDVEDKKLVEISCGYKCTLDRTPGVYKGEKYDCIQRDIRYNHASLGGVGWGRAGSEVRLRMDADGIALDGDRIDDDRVAQAYRQMCERRTDAWKVGTGLQDKPKADSLQNAIDTMERNKRDAWKTGSRATKEAK